MKATIAYCVVITRVTATLYALNRTLIDVKVSLAKADTENKMTQEEAGAKLLATGFCSPATVRKYLAALIYIQKNGWDKFEQDYDFAPYCHVPKPTRATERARLDKSHTLKIDFRHHLSLAGVTAELVKFSKE